MLHVLGIDPGIGGGVAILTANGKVVALLDTPTLTIARGKRDFDLLAMADVIRPYAPPAASIAAIEKVASMPAQGVASTFSFGRGYGAWLGMLAALQIPFEYASPRQWQPKMLDGISGTDTKARSRMAAKQLFPAYHERFDKAASHGLADALLIAEYQRRRAAQRSEELY